jgi:hypothetical protein
MSQHSAPIVKTILFVADQRHPWKLAQLTRHGVTYHTPTTVRTRDTGTMHQHQVYCLPDDAAWVLVQATQARLQAALDELAAGLRDLGSYASRLAEAGGMKTAPNPLCPTVISAPDPDTADEGYWFTSRLVPRIERGPLIEHTPKMLRRPSPYGGSVITFSQRDHFVCADDAAWARIEALIAAAKVAELNWATVLVELGKYSEALADGRYAKAGKEEPTVTQATTAHAGIWHNLPPKLAGWRWAEQTNSNYPPPARLHAPDGWATDEHSTSNQAIAEALRRMNRAPAGALTVAEQPIDGVPMMDQAEARETLDAMRNDLGQVELSLSSFRQRAAEFADRQGWKALGYSGVAEAINAELGVQYSKSYLSRLLKAAEIEKILELPMGNSVPERVLREVGQLDTPDQQRQAWQAATTASGGTPTVKAVEQAVAEIKPKPEQLPTHLTTCVRCGSERTLHRQLTSYEAGLVPEYPGRAVTLCSRCIPELLAARANPTRSDDAPITPESRDAAGPWFWASKSVVHPTAHCWNVRPLPSGVYVAACGLEMPIQPTSGAKGIHCSVCETHADRRQIVPIPGTGPTPITVQTSQGPREVVPLLSNGVIALHLSVAPGGTSTISHVATGRAVAQFARPASAEQAYAQLSALDWQLTPEGGTGPVLGMAISRIVTQYDDVDHYELRLTKLRELEAAAREAVSPIDDLTQRMALSLEAEYGIPVEVESWPPAAPAQPTDPDPRTQIAALLLQIAPLIAGLQTDDQPGLAEAINELNECLEGTEAAHWLNVGWALLDLVPESAVAS